MIGTDNYAKIRKCKQQGLSKRKTAEMLHMSRRTIAKYWDGAHTPDERGAYPMSVETAEKQSIMEALQKYFEENSAFSQGKQTLNAKTAWETLRETYHVGESTIRRYVRELKVKNPEGFLPLDFEPGEVLQVDWCEVKICIKGHIWKAPVFCAVLPFSYAIFAMIMPDMTMPCFIEGHVQAFSFFQGVPERVFYDNLKSAVLSGSGNHAVKQERFRILEAHYAYEAVFMNAASGNEKGGVENLCGLIRQVAFTPIPKGERLQEIQEQVRSRCLNYIRFHRIKDRKRPIAEMFDEERAHLYPLPVKAFEAHITTTAMVDSDLTFRYDATKYSLPAENIGRKITLLIYPYKIEAWRQGSLLYQHVRAFIKGDHQYIPEHYLPLLAAKPRSLNNAAPLKYGIMPPEMEMFRKTCSEKNKYEQLAQVLLLGQEVDASLLCRAVDYANKTGLPTIDKVRSFLALYNTQEICSTDMIKVQKQDFTLYDALLNEEGTPDE